MSEKETLFSKGPPTGFKRLFFRFPLLLYKAGLGPLFGERFLKLTHTGRVSGLRRETVLEVVKHDSETGACYVVSGWGRKSNWYLNILNTPCVEMQVKNRKFRADARELSRERAASVLYDYSRRYPRAFGILTEKFFGERLEVSEQSAIRLAESMPVIELVPSR
ncbi:MAG: nitroreductase family deazaflavin-dependent oxidoreductase [Deltaproteobacteria bacterium]